MSRGDEVGIGEGFPKEVTIELSFVGTRVN